MCQRECQCEFLSIVAVSKLNWIESSRFTQVNKNALRMLCYMSTFLWIQLFHLISNLNWHRQASTIRFFHFFFFFACVLRFLFWLSFGFLRMFSFLLFSIHVLTRISKSPELTPIENKLCAICCFLNWIVFVYRLRFVLVVLDSACNGLTLIQYTLNGRVVIEFHRADHALIMKFSIGRERNTPTLASNFEAGQMGKYRNWFETKLNERKNKNKILTEKNGKQSVFTWSWSMNGTCISAFEYNMEYWSRRNEWKKKKVQEITRYIWRKMHATQKIYYCSHNIDYKPEKQNKRTFFFFIRFRSFLAFLPFWSYRHWFAFRELYEANSVWIFKRKKKEKKIHAESRKKEGTVLAFNGIFTLRTHVKLEKMNKNESNTNDDDDDGGGGDGIGMNHEQRTKTKKKQRRKITESF